MGRSIPICCGFKKNGQPCQFRGRYDGRCKFHAPKEPVGSLCDCPICYEKITSSNMIKTSCKHEFHRSCLERWTSKNSSCPLCRAPVESERPTTGILSPRPVAPPIIYINSHEQLLPYLNAPVEIRFTQNYWGSF